MANRENLVKYITDTFPFLSDDEQKRLHLFFHENVKLSDGEFYTKLNQTFPTLNGQLGFINLIRQKSIMRQLEKSNKKLSSINAHLIFYTVILILSIVGYLTTLG